MPLKSKGEQKPKCSKSCCIDDQSSWVFLSNWDGDGEVVRLRHPATEKAAYFIFSKDNRAVYQLFTFNQSSRSYFIDNSVKSDGSVGLTVAVDPLFLALPYLAASSHCSPLDQILRDDEYMDIERLSENPRLQTNLTKISDKKGSKVFGFKYNEEKTLSWLEAKVMRTCRALKHQSVQVSSSASVVSNNFIKHSSDSSQSDDNYLRCAFGIVSDYLTHDLKSKLQSHMKITLESEQPAIKRNRSSSLDSIQDGTKKSKVSLENEENSPPKPLSETIKVKTPVLTAKEKARAKAATGSRNIASFFKKPVS